MEAERQFRRWAAQASGAPVENKEEDDWSKGVQFLKRNGLAYVPLDQLKADHKAQASTARLSQYEQRLAFVDDRLGIDAFDEETRDDAIEASLEARAVLGDLQPPVLRLSGALRFYLDEKAADLSRMAERSARGFQLEKERVITGLQKALGDDKPIKHLTRADALAYRNHLMNDCEVAPATTNKYIRVAHTIVQTVITHHSLRMENRFRSLRVIDGTPDVEKRDQLSPDEIRLALGSKARINEELGAILTLLICTGARLNEIAGLEVADVQPHRASEGPPYLWIRPNRTRTLKSKSSRRKVPLVGPGVQAAIDALARVGSASTDGPLFPRYGRNGGADAASQALMKFLRRAGITDRRKVAHSIRHSVKQALRNVGCPKDIRDAVQGHSAGDVAETYGSGFGMETTVHWLTAAIETFTSRMST